MAGRILVAVTSRDGIAVNERLHRASDCFVFEAAEGRVAFLERRTLRAETTRPYRDFSSLAALLRDCAWIVSLGFTGEARRELAARGFRLHEDRGPIEQVIRGLPLDTFLPRGAARGAGKAPPQVP
jgi:hypothetical protein